MAGNHLFIPNHLPSISVFSPQLSVIVLSPEVFFFVFWWYNKELDSNFLCPYCDHQSHSSQALDKRRLYTLRKRRSILAKIASLPSPDGEAKTTTTNYYYTPRNLVHREPPLLGTRVPCSPKRSPNICRCTSNSWCIRRPNPKTYFETGDTSVRLCLR